jgi:hypothetical protein
MLAELNNIKMTAGSMLLLPLRSLFKESAERKFGLGTVPKVFG